MTYLTTQAREYINPVREQINAAGEEECAQRNNTDTPNVMTV